MQLFRSCAPSNLKGHKILGIPTRALIPIGLVALALAGILSPLFNLSQVHGFPGPKLYTQHLFFDSVSDAGGYYAATFCKHWYHRVPIAIGFALASTFLLVTLVG